MASLPRSQLTQKVNDYLEYLEVEKGASPLTTRNYKHYLARLINWLKDKGIEPSLTAINAENVRQYRVFLSRFKGEKGEILSRKTQGYHVIAIRSFLRWLIRNDEKVLSPEKIDLPKISEREIRFLSGGEVDRILNAPSLTKISGKRNKAILEVLYSTGLRVSELVKLDKEKVDLERREFGIIGKGGRARVVFLSQRAADWVKKYLASRRDYYQPLFVRHKGKLDPGQKDEAMRLTARSVQRMIKKYSRKVKLPIDATPHTIRHSYATDLLMAGADIRSVQELLGHKNIQTTQIYTHVTNKRLKEVHESYHGRGK